MTAPEHDVLPSVAHHYPPDLPLGRGMAPGGYDTCYPGCPACAVETPPPPRVRMFYGPPDHRLRQMIDGGDA